MDAKSRASFINSVASGASIPCPKCGTSNNAGSKFCLSCGEELPARQNAQNSAPAFETAKEAPKKAEKYAEPSNVFAQGLPSWSLEPPQVMVRRH